MQARTGSTGMLVRRMLPVCALFALASISNAGDVSKPTTRVIRNPFDPIAAERGRLKLTSQSFLRPEWSERAYAGSRKFLGKDAPDPVLEPQRYQQLFNFRYGLHGAPFENDGFPMGLRKGRGRGGEKIGLQIDCMVCHGGSIGGKSYVGLGNTTLDLTLLLDELKLADGSFATPHFFTLNSTRGTVNAGQVAVVLLSHRNTDLSFRLAPLRLGANLPELDVPPWWHLARKKTMYYDGRTDARSVRSNMQFMLGEFSLDDFKKHEADFADIFEYFKSIESPKYPFPIETAAADRGEEVFRNNCVRCHGTYGPGGTYPNKIVGLDVIGTDPVRSRELSDGLVAHYNKTWLGQDHPVAEEAKGYQAPPLDGIWATAPYLHNGSVPTLGMLLESKSRPARFRKPADTSFEHYDAKNVGWRVDVLDPGDVDRPQDRPSPIFENRRIYDVRRRGLGNQGHTFGDDLDDQDRADLIEYLKTL